MWLTARTIGRAGQHGKQPPDIATTNSRATVSLSAASHLRQAMQPAQITDPGTTTPRPALPVGRTYALRVLFGAEGVIPMYSVDMRRVRKHCLLTLVQTTVRDLAALAAVAACFRIDQWGIGLTLALLLGAAILAGRSRLFLPLMIAAIVGRGGGGRARHPGPAGRARRPPGLPGRLLRHLPAGRAASDLSTCAGSSGGAIPGPAAGTPKPERKLSLRMPAESEYRRWAGRQRARERP